VSMNAGSMSNAKLSPPAVKLIRLFSAKYSYGEMARMLRVHRSTISRAVRRLTWVDVL
jgi:IS30 family transposase